MREREIYILYRERESEFPKCLGIEIYLKDIKMIVRE
jgi:hypothetical protein